MAGIPPSVKDSPVTCQMYALVQKAEQWETKDSILSKRLVGQIKRLIKIGDSTSDASKAFAAAEKKEINLERDLECWLEEVNTAISVADDLLDECAYYAHHHSLATQVNFSLSLSSMSSFLMMSNMTKRFKSVNSSLQTSLLKKGKQFSSEAGQNERSAAVQAKIDTSAIESEVVRENEKDGIKKIVDKLLHSDSDQHLSFISIVGWAGTGKTTLARLLYKDGDVMRHFDERMWLEAPSGIDMDRIAKSMLTSLTRSSVEERENTHVVQSLQQMLKGKRYLLVLDDAWEESIFVSLKDFLERLNGSRGCKVVITSGKEPSVEKISFFVYKMSLGTSDYCWTMFDKISFTQGGAVRTQELEKIGRSIVERCQGNPLYVKLLASVMYRMKAVSQWSRISKESEGWVDVQCDIPQLCFNFMSPIPLKRCFQYCFIFPKGYSIRREELIQLWMGQGYLNVPIPDRSDMVPEMVALGIQYYNILLRSSFLQVAQDDDFDGNSCKIHDLLRGVSLFRESSRYKTIENDEEVTDCSGAVHLSLINCKVKLSKALRESFSKLRTLRVENTRGLGDLLQHAKSLRVLIVVDGSMEALPSSIGKLIHLKYLDISRTKIAKLPDSISKLYNLQTLRLYDLQEPPRDFENLVSLRHLYIRNCKDSGKRNNLPPKFRGLVNLSSPKASFKEFLEKECKIDLLLKKLPNLCKSISLHRLENVTNPPREATNPWSSMMQRMESLKLHWGDTRQDGYDEEVIECLGPSHNLKYLAIDNFKGTTFPSWMQMPEDLPSTSYLPNLVKMELYNCSWCDQLPPLGRLPCLRILKIAGMDSVSCIAEEFMHGNADLNAHYSTVAFPALKEFTLFGMSNLEEWSGSSSSSSSSFPYLVRLDVEQCPMLIRVPDVVLHGMCILKLRIARSEKLTHLPPCLAQVESLEDLELFGLPALENLSIPSANSLKTLVIGCFSTSIQVNDLGDRLKHLSTSLTSLTIWGYVELEALPDWVADLRSLQVLRLESCGELQSFPSAEKMEQLTNLKELNICYCPRLEDKCTRGSRKEWHKVSRIPTIVVNNKIIRQPRPM